MMATPNKVLCILYSSGGIGDVGRHAIRAALDSSLFDEGGWTMIRVLTKSPNETLWNHHQSHWNCSCPGGHSTFTSQELQRLDVRCVDVTKDDLLPHLENVESVISALGNRQPFFGDRIGTIGTRRLVDAIQQQQQERQKQKHQKEEKNDDSSITKHNNINNICQRLVLVTSVGCNEDWPPVEFHWVGDILKWMFRTVSRNAYNDLCGAEMAVRNNNNNRDDPNNDKKNDDDHNSSLDYCIIRPMGLSNERIPVGEWFIQQEKYKDPVGPDISKLDCARLVVSEAIQPTYHRRAIVVGSQWDGFQLDF